MYEDEIPSPIANCFILSLRTACRPVLGLRTAYYLWYFHLHKEETKLTCFCGITILANVSFVAFA